MPNITEKNCRAEVQQRRKIYDASCAGFYVSLSPTAPPTFSLKYTCPITKQRAIQRLGVYQMPEHDVAFWRKEAWKLKIRIANGEDIALTARRATAAKARQQLTINELIDLRIAWISAKVPKGRDRNDKLKLGPRLKAHEEMTRHLNRFVRPRLGSMAACEVTKRDIGQLQADILAGTYFVKGSRKKGGSISNARHMRKAVSGLFTWAAKEDYVSTSPCVNLPDLASVPPKTRKLSAEEIAILWHGLERPDITVERRICLAIKFALLSMLRSTELLHIHRDELAAHDLHSAAPLVAIPEERVKSGRVIRQPLSDLAVEIAREAMGNQEWMFMGRFGDAPLNRKAMACALRGRSVVRKGKPTTYTDGLCKQLGLRPFTPHDLRRTAASLMGSLKIPRSVIGLCLDHTVAKDEHGEVAAVTGRHYDQDERIDHKREALQKLADEIRRIIAAPMQAADGEMRRAA